MYVINITKYALLTLLFLISTSESALSQKQFKSTLENEAKSLFDSLNNIEMFEKEYPFLIDKNDSLVVNYISSVLRSLPVQGICVCDSLNYWIDNYYLDGPFIAGYRFNAYWSWYDSLGCGSVLHKLFDNWDKRSWHRHDTIINSLVYGMDEDYRETFPRYIFRPNMKYAFENFPESEILLSFLSYEGLEKNGQLFYEFMFRCLMESKYLINNDMESLKSHAKTLKNIVESYLKLYANTDNDANTKVLINSIEKIYFDIKWRE